VGHRHVLILAVPAAICTLLICCKGGERVDAAKQQRAQPDRGTSGVELGAAQIERINEMGYPGPPPPDETNLVADDLRAAQLGHLLFFDAGLSSNGKISCATCHDPDRGFTDGLALNQGLERGRRNTLSVLDAAHMRWFNWDGRFDSLWGQSHGPISHPREMGSSFAQAVEHVRETPVLRERYEQIFGALPAAPAAGLAGETAIANIGKSIAAYERRLVTGPSSFDRWVARWRDRGTPRDADSVPPMDFSASALRGLDLFTSRGLCWQCHVGPLLSDGEFHALGAAPRNDLIADGGRFEAVPQLRASPFRSAGVHSASPQGEQGKLVESLVPQPDQWGAFRTPNLRNVALTAPYFHQGQFATLEEVVAFYSTLEGAVTMDHHRESVLRRRDFSPEESADIVAFLRSLTGESPPADWVRDPWQLGPGQSIPMAEVVKPTPVAEAQRSQ
jgi:cytochrome c peroxidase